MVSFNNLEAFERECDGFEPKTLIHNDAGKVLEFQGIGLPASLIDIMADTGAEVQHIANRVYIPFEPVVESDAEKSALEAQRLACLETVFGRGMKTEQRDSGSQA